MKTPNEFWLCAHRLADAYEAEGRTPQERATNITDEFLAMPPAVRLASLDNLRTLWLQLGDLYPIVSAADNVSEEPRGKRKGGAA